MSKLSEYANALRALKHPIKDFVNMLVSKPPWEYRFADDSVVRLTQRRNILVELHAYYFHDAGTREYNLGLNKNPVVLNISRFDDGSEVFKELIYSSLPVWDRIVVDIGANIGDSPIYFKVMGARQVFGYEPNKGIYDLALKNVKLNCAESIVTIENKAVVGELSYKWPEHKYIEIQPDDFKAEDPRRITLEGLVIEKGIDNGILKIDCEGCEYEVILSSRNEIIRRFSHIQMEYHFGGIVLKERLERIGYDVKISKSKYTWVLESNILMEYGDLYAVRRW